MESNASRVHDPRQAIFKDGLGTRYRRDGADGPFEILVLRDAFAPIPSFEFLVRERVNRLAHVRSEHFARVYDVEHVPDGAKVAIVSRAAAGVRLSRMLAIAEQNLLPLDVESALCVLRQLLTAMSELHDDAPDACHGTLSADRVVVTSTGRVVVVEHVLGAALAQLRHSPERYWKELRIALPIAVTAPLLDRRADVAQIGMIALALMLGRPIADGEYPDDVAALANGSFGLGGGFEPFPEWLRTWLSQALSLEPTRWFASAVEARHAFEAGLKSGGHGASEDRLLAFLREYSRFDPIEPARTMPVAAAHAAAAPVAASPASTPVLKVAKVAPAAAAAPAPFAAPSTFAAPSAFSGPSPFSAPAAVAAAPAVVAAPTVAAPAAASAPAVAAAPARAAAPVAAPAPVVPPAPRPVPVAVTPAPAPVAAPAPAPSVTPAPAAMRPSVVPMVPKDPPRQNRAFEPEPPRPSRAFETESPRLTDVEEETEETQERVNHRPRLIAAAVVVIALTSGGVMAARRYFAAPVNTPPSTGTVVVNTEPAGVNVVIDGQAHGMTPTTATLSVGTHTIELSTSGARRTMTVNVAAGAQVSQFIEMPKAVAGTGDLQVRTDPAGAKVSVDGQPRGVSPLTISALTPGSHMVALENDLGSVNQEVSIQPGATASLVVPMKAPQGAPVSGWISIVAPAELQIFENQKLLGSSRTDRIMVATGRHEIEFSNDTLGYRGTQTINVGPGQVARLRPEWPQGTIAINATPWANVTLDGQDLGETPVGNTSVPIGTHEVVFRHPQLGEQRFTATVTATAPARLSVDMRKK
jgi:hypothetical protein